MNCASVLPKDHEITAENGSTESSSSTESSAHIDGASIDPPVTPTTPAPAPVSTATESKNTLKEVFLETKKIAEEAAEKIKNVARDIKKNPDNYREECNKIQELYIKNPENLIKAAGIERFMNLQYENVPIGIILIITGFFLTFFGRRIFKAFLTVSGTIVGASLFLYAFILVESIAGVSGPQWVFWLVILSGAVSGAALFNKAWKLSVYITSGYGGFALGLWILGMINSIEIYQYIDRNFFLAFFTLMGLISAHFIDEFVIISSSSLIGSFTAAFGYDMIHCFGFRLFVKNTIDNSPTNFVDVILENTSINTSIRICMICVLLMTLGGIYVQYRHQPRTYDRK